MERSCAWHDEGASDASSECVHGSNRPNASALQERLDDTDRLLSEHLRDCEVPLVCLTGARRAKESREGYAC
jgi:hypothetical protein